MNKTNYLVWFLTIIAAFAVAGIGTIMIINYGELAAYLTMGCVLCGWIFASSYVHFVVEWKKK